MVVVYRPDHPQANENGMIDKSMLPNFDSSGLYVVSDTIEPTRHMCDGNYYTSKKKFREVTRAYGCVEVGNETATLTKPRKPIELDRRQRRDDIRRAIYQLRNGIG